ncbi:hypothetical protein DL768_006653 [Monosporascus sp. mg162]|nr:hypothetical protein DL768_006653 [Monosporascus sp. mg162]
MVHFPGTEYRTHTSCMTEEQKYQGSTYKPKKQKPNGGETTTSSNNMAHHAYVEDVTEEYEAYRDYEIRESDGDDDRSTTQLPEAPTPPPATATDANVNVFDFLVDATPTASTIDLPQTRNLIPEPTHTRQLVRFDQDQNGDVDPTGYMVDDEHMVQYGDGPVTSAPYETPVPKSERRKSKDSETKKNKKRKQLHIETPGPMTFEGPSDQVMTDAPPVLHSGLTGGLKSLMRPSQFPPSPDYSGGDARENSPIAPSPLKKSKHAKAAKASRPEGSGFRALVSGTSKAKVSKKRKQPTERKEKKKKHHHHHSDGEKVPKFIEYRAPSGDAKAQESGQMIVYRPRSDLFLSLCNKGPESERGCSVNSALKKYHRERSEAGTSLSKAKEEKELWKSLRMRRNERGEIVLFTLEDVEE